jgi:hypothetical protein
MTAPRVLRVAQLAVAALLSVAMCGCTLLGTGVLSFAAGTLLSQVRALTLPPVVVIERQCFRDGQPIDCALVDALGIAADRP